MPKGSRGGSRGGGRTAIKKDVMRSFSKYTTKKDARSGVWEKHVKNEIGRSAFNRGIDITTKGVNQIYKSIVNSLPD